MAPPLTAWKAGEDQHCRYFNRKVHVRCTWNKSESSCKPRASMLRDQRGLNDGVRHRRIGNQRAAMAVRGRAEVAERVLPEQGEVLDRRTAADRQRAAAGGELRPGQARHPAGGGGAPQGHSLTHM